MLQVVLVVEHVVDLVLDGLRRRWRRVVALAWRHLLLASHNAVKETNTNYDYVKSNNNKNNNNKSNAHRLMLDTEGALSCEQMPSLMSFSRISQANMFGLRSL